jgi:hypothetical protein
LNLVLGIDLKARASFQEESRVLNIVGLSCAMERSVHLLGEWKSKRRQRKEEIRDELRGHGDGW